MDPLRNPIQIMKQKPTFEHERFTVICARSMGDIDSQKDQDFVARLSVDALRSSA